MAKRLREGRVDVDVSERGNKKARRMGKRTTS